MVRRRATPSSSTSASAPVSWLAVATRTDLPVSSPSRPAKLVPLARSVTRADAARFQKNRFAAGWPMRCRSGCASARAIFVNFQEAAERHGNLRALGRRKRIDAEPVFETGNQHSETQRVEA